MKVPLIVLCVCVCAAAQSLSFEKLAISAAQQVPASSLDARLPNRSFAVWLNGLVGKEAGIVWQLAECGDGAPSGTAQDALACVEATVLLPNGATVIVGISVGTFKEGVTGEPIFRGAVIKKGEQLYQVRRLSDLPAMLRSPRSVPRILPDLQTGSPQVDLRPYMMPYPTMASLGQGDNNSAPGFLAEDEASPPPPPPRQSQRNSAEAVEASAIKKPKPIYPAGARTMGVSGKVEVRIVISETGRVIEATAISGHVALRAAAEDAARNWVYKPATRDGVPVATESVLTFTFNPSGQ